MSNESLLTLAGFALALQTLTWNEKDHSCNIVKKGTFQTESEFKQLNTVRTTNK